MDTLRGPSKTTAFMVVLSAMTPRVLRVVDESALENKRNKLEI